MTKAIVMIKLTSSVVGRTFAWSLSLMLDDNSTSSALTDASKYGRLLKRPLVEGSREGELI